MKQDGLSEPKRRKTHKGWYRLRRPQNGPVTTRQYTAQDVHHRAHSQKRPAGVIRPDTGDLHLSADLAERGEGRQTKPPPRVMLVIIALALVFIAIITYFVSQMPPKT